LGLVGLATEVASGVRAGRPETNQGRFGSPQIGTWMDRWPGRPSCLVYSRRRNQRKWGRTGMRGPISKTPHPRRSLGANRGVAPRMGLRHLLPTQARDGQRNLAVLWPQTAALPWCVRSHPTDGAPRLGSRRVRRLPAPTYRSCVVFFSARSRLATEPASFFSRLSVIG
jgi:hypothetical protein